MGGDRVMLAVGSGLYETRTIDSIATDYKSFTVSKAFSSSVTTTGEYTMYIVGKGSKGQSALVVDSVTTPLVSAHASKATPSKPALSSPPSRHKLKVSSSSKLNVAGILNLTFIHRKGKEEKKKIPLAL